MCEVKDVPFLCLLSLLVQQHLTPQPCFLWVFLFVVVYVANASVFLVSLFISEKHKLQQHFYWLQHRASPGMPPYTVCSYSRNHPSSFPQACPSALFAWFCPSIVSSARLFSLLYLSRIMIHSLLRYIVIDWAFQLTNELAPQGHVEGQLW